MKIRAAAINKDGIIYVGYRHHNIINANVPGFFKNCIQGFVTDEDKFVDRAVAAEIAYKAKQISKRKKRLFSEDIY